MNRARPVLLLALGLAMATTNHPAWARDPWPAAIAGVRSQLQSGKLDDAIEAAEAATKASAGEAAAWFWLARACAQKAMSVGMFSAARWAGRSRDALEKAVALDPAFTDARLDLLEFYAIAPGLMGGSREKADAQAASLRRLDPSAGRLADAILAQQDGNATLAEQAFREAIALAPGNNRARVDLSMFLQAAKRWRDSEAVWRDVLARDPDDPLAHYQLGRLSALTGEQLEEGLDHLQRFLDAPDSPIDDANPAGAYWRRGQILARLGRTPEAIAALERALQLNPGLEKARADLARLAR